MTRDGIKDVLLEIIEDIDEEAELNLLKPNQPLPNLKYNIQNTSI